MKAVKRDLPMECWRCHRNGQGDPLEWHHVFGGANRKKSELYGAKVPLCGNRCHRNGAEAVHRNAEVDLELKREWQQILMKENGWTEDDFRLEFGRSYL